MVSGFLQNRIGSEPDSIFQMCLMLSCWIRVKAESSHQEGRIPLLVCRGREGGGYQAPQQRPEIGPNFFSCLVMFGKHFN